MAIGQWFLRYKWWGVIITILLISTGLLVWYFQSGKTKPAAAATVRVTRGLITSEVAATGTINPVNMVDISSKISGLVKEVLVGENQPITAGQVLLTLDDTHLQSQLKQAEAKLREAVRAYERNEKLKQAGAISAQQFDSAALDYQLAQAAYEDALSQLADTVIKSPISGMVIGKPIPAGQAVAPGISTPMVLLTVADMSKMQIQAQVDESDIGKVKTGQKVTFTVDAYPGKTFSGVVTNVSQKATVQQNVVYYSVLVDIDDPAGLLRPTMTARANITVGANPNALLVPLAAVKTVNGQTSLSVLQNGVMQTVPVTTGLTSDTQIEILDGAAEGTQVALPQAAKPQSPGGNGTGGAGGAGGVNMLRGLGR